MSSRTKNNATKLTCNCACKGRCKYPDWCPKCSVIKCRPEVPTKWADGTLDTTYQREYIEKNAPRTRSARGLLQGKDFIPDMVPLSAVTTSRTDYGPKQIPNGSPRPRESPLPLDPFRHSTTYADAHRRFPLTRATVPRLEVPSLDLPLDGTSSYKTDYPPRDVRLTKSAAPLRTLPPYVPFDGLSEYKDRYVKNGGERRANMKPNPALIPSLNSDPNSATYASDYRRFPFTSPYKPPCCNIPTHRTSMRPPSAQCDAK